MSGEVAMHLQELYTNKEGTNEIPGKQTWARQPEMANSQMAGWELTESDRSV